MTLPTRVGSTSAKQSGTTAVTIDISGIADGSYMVAEVVAGNTTVAITLPAGWTVLAGPNTVGSRRYWVIARIKQSGDTFTVTKALSLVLNVVMHWGAGAAAVASWIVGSAFARSSGTSADDQYAQAPSINTVDADTLAIAIMVEATSAEDTTPQALTGTGWAQVVKLDDQASPDTNFIEQVMVAYKEMTSPGATGTPQTNYQNAQNINAGGIQIGIPPSAPANVAPTAAFTHDETDLAVDVDGTTSTDSDGTIVSYSWDWGDSSTDDTGATQSHTYASAGTYTVTLTVTDDDGATDTQQHDVTVTAPPPSPAGYFDGVEWLALHRNGHKASAMYFNGVLLHRWGYTVDDMMAEEEIQVAWRGLGTTRPEMAMSSYDYAVAQGFKVLEVSIRRSSDGVWIMNHDADLSRTTASSATIASTAAASMLGVAIDFPTTGGVIGRLEDLLDAYAETHVLFIDIKSNEISLGGYDTEVLAILDNYPDPTQHFVWKGFRGWTPSADTWRAAGYKAWGIYYGNEIGEAGSPHSSVSHFDLLGMNVAPVDGGSTYWNNALATGKRVIGHVCQSSTHIDLARTRGATGLMTGVVP